MTIGELCLKEETKDSNAKIYHSNEYAGKACLTMFGLGFFFPPIWLATMYYRNSKSRMSQRWRMRSLRAFWILVALLLALLWISMIVVFGFIKEVKTAMQSIASATASWIHIPGDIIALFFLVSFTLVVGWDVIMKLNDARVRKTNRDSRKMDRTS